MEGIERTFAAVAGPFGNRLDSSFARIERCIDAARHSGASLVVLPEGALGGYLRVDGRTAEPIDVDGPEIARLCELAGDMVVCAGFTERSDRRPYSSAICVSGDGVLGHHRKVHLPPSEIAAFAPGQRFAAFDT